SAEKHFSVLIEDAKNRLENEKPVVIGINGCQGSGKSTLAAYLEARLSSEYRLCVANLSVDDFYLTKAGRSTLAEQVHPLLSTRGVPGTHDIPLFQTVLDQLCTAREGYVSIPRFDKSTDDRKPLEYWDKQKLPVDIILLEGWCLGARAQTQEKLVAPINDLERNRDKAGQWRAFVNKQLATVYPSIFSKVDVWVMLKAPSFDSVFRWRLEQEQKLAKKLQGSLQLQKSCRQALPGELMNAKDIATFVQHFQRLTEHILRDMPAWATHVYTLDENRKIIDEKHRTSNTGNPFRL
ncbi:MAG: hypothetical protein KDI30_09210, partial [Pseudomonadales bacterium]|nr:hypothetical protein [Pseudomonadales bacterium]